MENKNNKKIDGNTHAPHECPYCWRVLYSKGALTVHINKEHWDEEDGDIDVAA